MIKFSVRKALGYDVDAVSESNALAFDPELSVTQQQFKEECDINVIVGRFLKTGQVPSSFKAPLVGDFTEVGDYHSAMNAVISAQGEFMKLPAAVREKFKNDPGALITFLSDDGNRKEAEEMGLIPKPPEKTRDVVQAVDELAAKLVVDK